MTEDSLTIDTLDPGECTERYERGWRLAEFHLRHGARPTDDAPDRVHEETFNGYIGRMAQERHLRDQLNSIKG